MDSDTKSSRLDPPGSLSYQSTDEYTNEFKDATRDLKMWIKTQKQLDIYQMNSFYVAVVWGLVNGCHIQGFFDKGHWKLVGLMLLNFYKTALTIIIQIGAIDSYLSYEFPLKAY